MVALTLDHALSRLEDVRRGSRGWTARCPAHAGRRRSLEMWTEDGGPRFKCYRGCSVGAIRAALLDRPAQHTFGLQLGNPAEGIDDEVRIGWARRIWSEARPAAGTLVARYLRSRGIMVEPPPTLRFATALKHPSGRYFPAMVAAVQSMDAQIVGIQRTYLKSDGSGKAAVDPSKLSLGVCAGGCVRLAQADDVVVLAEGVETALSVMQATGLAAWSTLGTSGLKAVRLPDSIRRVFIAADGDLAGKTASYDAARHLLSEDPKRQVKLVTPPSADSDWNDLLRGAPI